MSVIKKEKALKETENEMRELRVDELEEIAGAGDPFEDIPYVPTKPIDDDLRHKS